MVMRRLSPDIPFKPASFPFFYGWFLLVFGSLGVVFSMPGQTAGFSGFTEPVLKAAEINRTALSLCYMGGTLISGLTLPFVTVWIDRIGARISMIGAALGLGAGLFFLSHLTALTSLLFDVFATFLRGITAYPFFSNLSNLSAILSPSWAAMVVLIVGIFCIRFFGQGLMVISSNTMIGKWFDKKRGRAMAFINVFNSLAFASAPAVMAYLVFSLGWENAWRFSAYFFGFGMAVLAFLFFRDYPEACGLQPDGNNSSAETDRKNDQMTHENRQEGKPEIKGETRRNALKTRAFWGAALSAAIHASVFTGIVFHIHKIGMQSGIDPKKAVKLFIPLSFITLPLSFLGSWISDKIKFKNIMIVMLIGQIIGFTAFRFFSHPAGFVLIVIGLGLSGGMFGPLNTASMPHYFGRRHLGSINGVFTSILVVSSSLGPVFLSALNDLTGSLSFGVGLAAVFSLVVLILAFGIKEAKPGHDVLKTP